MKFVNEHQLLVYLVELDETEDRWRLSSGKELGDHLRVAGLLDASRPDQEYPELGRMLSRLKDDNSISYVDRAAAISGQPRYEGFTAFSMDDVWKFEGITVRREGRMAVNAERSATSADAPVERLIAALTEAADEERDPERKGRLREVADGLAGVGRAVATETLAALVRQRSGLP